jgi:hypothetical protein
MLDLIEDDQSKKKLHERMQKILFKTLKPKGRFKVPNAAGGEPNPRKGGIPPEVYAERANGLFYAPLPLATDGGARTWDAFGLFDPMSDTQSNIVQINIPFLTNSVQAAAGFFAKDANTKVFYILHTGKLSGQGMKKLDVLSYFKRDCVLVREGVDGHRIGIRVAILNDELAAQIEQFTRRVAKYKAKIRSRK